MLMMASSSSTLEDPSTLSIVADAPPLVSVEAKMIVATGHARCQQLKDIITKEDTSSMVVVVASSNQTSVPSPPSAPVVMDPGLLAVACSGSWKKLQSFLNGDPRPNCCCNLMKTIRCCCLVWKFPHKQPCPASSNGTTGCSGIQQPSRDQEALERESFLDGVTTEGDTFLHVMATKWAGEKLEAVGLIHRKAVQFLSKPNNNGDTPLHCAARAGVYQMVYALINLARDNDVNSVRALLETENNSRWTVLHEAVHFGNVKTVNLLMEEDPKLASFPRDGTSPLYLAILLENKIIADTLYEKSAREVQETENEIVRDLSYSGPNGQNALHAAVLRCKDLTNRLLRWNNKLAMQQDENGNTPLHLAASVVRQRDGRIIRLQLLKAYPDALYQPDHEGSFPIHVAANVDATVTIGDFIKRLPSCAGLRDRSGRTFLHIAVEKSQTLTVGRTCRNRSLSWILNMQDNNGNTALHLAVQAGGLIVFAALFGNRNAHLSLTNGKGETPLDISSRARRCSIKTYNMNSDAVIHRSLKAVNAESGICRQDNYEENDTVYKRQAEVRQMEMVKDATQNLCIGAVLISTVTFGATFAMPGGYRSDDHPNGGTPTLAGRYVFEAFVWANALAFTFSTMATTALLCSGSPTRDTRVRRMHYSAAYYLLTIAVQCLVATFAIATYTILAPVAHMASVGVCVMSSLILLYDDLELIMKHLSLVAAFYVRKGIVFTVTRSVSFIARNILIEYWPIMVILLLPLRNYPAGKVEQVPTPLP